MAFRRSACVATMRKNRSASCGSRRAPSNSVSTKPLIDVIGVFSSCDTLATKSRRMFSKRRKCVTSESTTTAPMPRPAASRRRGAADLQGAIGIAVQDDVVLDGPLAHQHAPGEAPQIEIADHLVELSAQGVGKRIPHQLRGGLVERDHALLGVDGQYALDHAGQHGLLLVALLDDRPQAIFQLARHLVERTGQAGHLFGRRR